MTTFPGSPRLTKGAIVGIDLLNPLASVIIFQYNPKSLSRQVQTRSSGQDGARAEVLRLEGPPTETITNTVLLAAGTIEVVPPEAPFTLFIWGAKRVLPVRITGFTIVEQEYTPSLNPIRATVNLQMTVLTYNDFPVTHPGYHLFLAHQVVKEAMATVGSVNNLAAVAGGNLDIP
jgi:hypothetical protein